MVDPIIIVVAPVGRGRFRAQVDGRTVVTSSRQPFLAAARTLAAEGVDLLTRITMRHEGQSCYALTSTVGVAARLSVDDTRGAPRFTRWDGARLRGVSSPIRESDPAGVDHRSGPPALPTAAASHGSDA